MTFSEYIEKKCNHDYIESLISDIDSLLAEYNVYITEEQNKPVTSEFLLGLGFGFENNICFLNKEYSTLLYDFTTLTTHYLIINKEFMLPFPKTQKDVLDLIRLLELN